MSVNYLLGNGRKTMTKKLSFLQGDLWSILMQKTPPGKTIEIHILPYIAINGIAGKITQCFDSKMLKQQENFI